jgi:hypothetical protein
MVFSVVVSRLKVASNICCRTGKIETVLLYENSTAEFSHSLGQKAKYSLRANVVRCCPSNRHAATAVPCPFGANNGHRVTMKMPP